MLVPSAALASGSIAELPTPSAQTNGEVDAIAVDGNIAYIGGVFTAVRPAGSPSGSGNVTRNHLAAINLTTGALLPWNPGASGDVRALAVSPDGSTIYVGGTFTTLGGASRTNVGAVTSGGTATSWNPGASAEVRALTIANSKLYAGGKFTNIAGTSRTRLAAFDLPGLGLDTSWRPSANNTVTSLVPAKDGSGRIFAGGYFTSIGGDAAQVSLAALDGASGSPTAWQDHPVDHVDALAVTASQVFAGEGGPGGKAQGFDQGTGARQWSAQFDGDVQAIAASGNLVYVGGHFVEYCIGGTGSGAPFVCDNPLSRGKLAAVAQSDGSIDDWNPQTNGSLGAYALATTSDGLAAGGQMTRYGLNLPSNQQVAQEGFAHFGPAGGGGGDTTPPSAPTNLAASSTGQTSVHLSWNAATDNVGVTGYKLVRNGSVVDVGNVTSYDDTGLSPGTPYTYTVRAYDAAGNTSGDSNTATATTDSGGGGGNVFADDFESGNLSKWAKVTGNVTVQGTNVHGGSFAADARSQNTTAWAYANIAGQTDLSYDFWFRVNSKSTSTVDVAQLRTAGGSTIVGVQLTGSTNRLRVRNAVSATTVTAATTVATGAWHHLVVHLTIAGASGHTDVSLDGASIAALSRTWNTGSNPIGRLTIGNSTKKTVDIAYDDVLAHT